MTDETRSPDFEADSILSYGERDVARRLQENPAATPAEIADARGVDAEAVEKAIDRIREKTHRALATLDQSPFSAEAAADLDAPTRERILAGLTPDGERD